MTFEEFFVKKKIDLVLLRGAKPDLYEEFRQHYAQMGEKSFDHTKKYWFNRLRQTFLLQTLDAPVATPPAGAATAASEKTPPSEKTPDLPTEAPQPAATPEAAATVADKPTTPTTKPVGFKPRFKAGVTSPAAEAPQPDTEPSKPASEARPLGFKPRFKAGVTNASKPNAEGEEPEKGKPEPAPEPTPGTTSKPLGFKPRFKGGSPPNKKDDAT